MVPTQPNVPRPTSALTSESEVDQSASNDRRALHAVIAVLAVVILAITAAAVAAVVFARRRKRRRKQRASKQNDTNLYTIPGHESEVVNQRNADYTTLRGETQAAEYMEVTDVTPTP